MGSASEENQDRAAQEGAHFWIPEDPTTLLRPQMRCPRPLTTAGASRELYGVLGNWVTVSARGRPTRRPALSLSRAHARTLARAGDTPSSGPEVREKATQRVWHLWGAQRCGHRLTLFRPHLERETLSLPRFPMGDPLGLDVVVRAAPAPRNSLGGPGQGRSHLPVAAANKSPA